MTLKGPECEALVSFSIQLDATLLLRLAKVFWEKGHHTVVTLRAISVG